MSELDKALLPALQQRRDEKLYRQRAVVASPQQVNLLRDGQDLISFCSNDYLGLANHPDVIKAMQTAAGDFGVGSGASHLVSGHSLHHHQLEEELADFTGRERALLFSTGYMANVGVINALLGRKDAVFEDRLNHASLLDGGLISGAEFVRYRHNNMEDLAQRLVARGKNNRKLIVVDGVFSMDGDYAALPELSALAREHDAWLMVDDAHGLGCVGDSGRGSVEQFGLSHEDVPILMGTLGKAFGTFGAFVAGSETLIESLIQFARPYIYTTALPPAVAAATRASLKIIKQEPQHRHHLHRLIHLFKSTSASKGIELMPSDTAIQPVVVGESEKALALASGLQKRGYWVTAIRPPTVPKGSARLRVTLSAQHSEAQVVGLVEALAEALRHA